MASNYTHPRLRFVRRVRLAAGENLQTDKMNTLILLRGMPGCGKTTLARTLAPEANFAADDYFYNYKGEYVFNRGSLGAAHNQCFKNTEEAMYDEKPLICVHNTFTTMKEMRGYERLAARHGYRVHVVHVEGNFGNTHNVPQENLDMMASRWTPYHKEER